MLLIFVGWTHPLFEAALPQKSQGYIQVFLDGGLNQQRMGVGTLRFSLKFS